MEKSEVTKEKQPERANVAPNYSYLEFKPDTWREVKQIGEKLPYYIFRGQSNYEWGLETKFKRISDRYLLSNEDRIQREKWILEAFKSRASQYIQSPPHDEEIIEWLSFMQHYGAPTRLLDFTRSFYVAAFFAVDQAEQDSSIWCISELALYSKFFEHIKNAIENGVILPFEIGQKVSFFPFDPKPSIRYAEKAFSEAHKNGNFVLRISPPKLNERLAVQQGLFLFPGNIEKSFEGNLCGFFDLTFDSFKPENANIFNEHQYPEVTATDPKNIPKEDLAKLYILAPVIKIKLPKKIHTSAIEDLNRMNINNASLFPGLDGFSKDLAHYLIPGNRLQFSINLSYGDIPKDV